MNLRQLLVACCAVAMLAWNVGMAQQAPNPQSPAQTAPGTASTEGASAGASSDNVKSEKQKHWSGSLVDIGCMAKALNNQNNGANPSAGTSAPVSHFADSGSPMQAGQQPGGIAPGQGPVGQGQGTSPALPGQGQNQNSQDMSPEQAAQIARANKVDDAARQCVPSSSTQVFGLAMSGGQVVKFDADGNTKAQEAIKGTEVEPGKKVKAKVTGTMEDRTTVRVASVEVKGKRASASSPNSASGAGQ
jgi:hypothetical protein